MKLKLILLFLLYSPTFILGQNLESNTRKFIDNAEITLINKDWSIEAIFKSGIGETVTFYPVEVINLKTSEKIEALQIDMIVKPPGVLKTAWVGLDEINEFVLFVENYVIPNLDVRLKNQSSEYIFKAKEMTLSYRIHEKTTRISIWLNNYEELGGLNYYFWTETQTNKIPNLLEILKILNKPL